MLRRILVRPTQLLERGVDVGTIGEAILFYGEAVLVLTESDLRELTQRIGVDTLLTLVESEFVKVVVTRDLTVTQTNRVGGREVHDFGTIEIARGEKRLRSRLEIVRDVFESVTGKAGKSRRSAYRFLRHATIGSFNDEVEHERGIAGLSSSDLEDARYVSEGTEAIMRWLLPTRGTAPYTFFNVEKTDAGFIVETDLDFGRVSRLRQALTGTDYGITPALVLDLFHKARTDLHLSARFEAELLSSEVSTQLVERRLGRAATALGRDGSSKLELFQREALQGRSVAEAVNEGERSFEDLLRLLETAAQFREWIAAQPADASLLQEYLVSIEKGSWLERLPAKSVRFALFNGLGVAADLVLTSGLGTLTGLTLTAADTFILNRIGRGWRPDQFVGGSLRTFVGGAEEGPAKELKEKAGTSASA